MPKGPTLDITKLAAFPCGWDQPKADGDRIVWMGFSLDQDEVEGLARGLLEALQDARKKKFT